MATPHPSRVYGISWDGIDWKCQLAATKTKFPPPNPQLGRALDAFKIRYYPDEPLEATDWLADTFRREIAERGIDLKNDYCDDLVTRFPFDIDPIHKGVTPWRAHAAANVVYKEADRADLMDESVSQRLQASFGLAWHWKALLPELRRWNANDSNSYIVQVSQVRQWELLLCYKVTTATLRKHPLPDIPLSAKNLLRPPFLTTTHRLVRWDVYCALFDGGVIEQIKAASEGDVEHENRYMASKELANLMGRHDCYYSIGSVTPKKGGYDLDVTTSFDLTPHAASPTLLGLENRPLSDANKRIAIPPEMVSLPSSQEGDKGDDGASVLFASENYCKALSDLIEVVNDPTARAVAVIAPPGSGKEDLAKFAHRFRESKGKFVATSLAGLHADEVRKVLFRLSDEKGFSPDKKQEFGPRNGFLWQACGGTLFIDEIDKTSEEVRSMLLRFLESGEVAVPGESNLVHSLSKDERPLYFFAASKSREEVFKTNPIDFWTRISHVVTMAHPLEVGDESRSQEATEAYAQWFLLKQAADRFISDEVFKGDEVFMEPVRSFYVALLNFMLRRDVVEFMASTITKELRRAGQPTPSVRSLRSACGRSVARVLDFLALTRDVRDGMRGLRPDLTGTLGDGEEPEALFDVLATSVSRFAMQDPDLQPEERSFVDRLRVQVVEAARLSL